MSIIVAMHVCFGIPLVIVMGTLWYVKYGSVQLEGCHQWGNQ